MKQLPAIALLVANLGVALVSLAGDWGFYEIALVYWFEAMIVGGFTVLRLIVVGLAGAPLGSLVTVEGAGSRLFLLVLVVGFFVVKFGAFALSMGVLTIAIPSIIGAGDDSGSSDVWTGLFAVGQGVILVVLALVASHAISFALNFIGKREYRGVSMPVLLFWPYVRMSLVMFTLAAGLVAAALLPTLERSTVFGIVVVIVKVAGDLVMHAVEHSRFADTTSQH